MDGLPTIIIGLTAHRQVNVEDIGRILIDLQSDYKRLYGQSLVLRHIETGSAWLFLQEALIWVAGKAVAAGDLAQAASRMLDFGKKVQETVARKQGKLPVANITGYDENEKLKFLDRAIKTMAKAGGGFEYIEEVDGSTNNRRTVVRLTPPETKEIEKSEIKRKKAQRKDWYKLPQSERGGPHPIGSMAVSPEVMRSVGERLDALQSSASPHDIQFVVETVAELLNNWGATHLLEHFAQSMELKDRHDIAVLIRRHIPPQNRIPITTE
ncbi:MULTISPECIES: hypothetical protein [unclassified Mesorhizobium]|uniref:hypothetical protein n=1 Tax=unclassified Mesorhizobium TaxID=325217 RepID=UPI000AFE2226|nr:MULTISPECIES: hypothetical protein [unclassified Mesorhizobium]